jgi:hypothetical protein
MFMGSETQREQGLHHLEMIKKRYFHTAGNQMQTLFDHAPEEWKRLLCFRAGLKVRHLSMTFDELSPGEKQAVIDAVLAIKRFGSRLNNLFR